MGGSKKKNAALQSAPSQRGSDVAAPVEAKIATPAPAAVPEAGTTKKRIPLLANEKLMRLEAEEQRILAEALYQTTTSDKDDGIDSRVPFVPRQTTKEKIEGFKKFAQLLSDPTNQRVLRVFLFVSLAMFSVPVVGLFVGMHIVAPALGMQDDKETCGGLVAVAASVFIMIGYVFYALREDAMFNEHIQRSQMAAKKLQKQK